MTINKSPIGHVKQSNECKNGSLFPRQQDDINDSNTLNENHGLLSISIAETTPFANDITSFS
jgi:hypothetical protein